MSLPGGRQVAVLAQRSLQPLPHLGGLPRLQADLLRPLAGGKDLGLKVQPPARQRAQRIGRLQVDKVLRSLRGVQLRLGGRAPAVRLGAQVLDLAHRRLGAQKGRHIGGQRTGRQPVDHAMALIAPGVGMLRLRDKANQHTRTQGCSYELDR